MQEVQELWATWRVVYLFQDREAKLCKLVLLKQTEMVEKEDQSLSSPSEKFGLCGVLVLNGPKFRSFFWFLNARSDGLGKKMNGELEMKTLVRLPMTN